MKKLAARDFEDILQARLLRSLFIHKANRHRIKCSVTCFSGLLPEPHNTCVLNMLFDLATWHAYAKLRVHTTDMLAFFETATTALRKSIQQFMKTTCEYYRTYELPQETTVRGRRKAAVSGRGGGVQGMVNLQRKERKLNLSTYKFHALGDYPNTIREMGTTDNYTTQPVSLF